MKPRYITLAGIERPLYFGFNALFRFEKQTGVPFSKVATLFEDITLETLRTMLAIGLEEGARREGVAYDLTLDQLTDALDEFGIAGFDQVLEPLMSFFVPTDEADEGAAVVGEPGEDPAV